MLKLFKKKISIWMIARKAKITNEALKYYRSEFDTSRISRYEFHRWSDCRGTAYFSSTGWENLGLNKNFRINSDNAEFLFNNKITLTYPVGNFACAEKYETKDFKLLELVKNNALSDITLEDLIHNKSRWTNIFINENFVNDSIWELILKPFFTKENVSTFLSSVNSMLD